MTERERREIGRTARLVASTLTFLVLISGCDAPPQTRPDAGVSPTGDVSGEAAGSWEGPPPPENDGSMEVGAFNAFLDAGQPSWDASPLRTAVEYVRLEDPSALRTSVEVEASQPEGAERTLVTIVEDGLADDSVAAVRWVIHLARRAEGWRLVRARWGQRCQEGRGHQTFSTELCV